MTVEPSSRNGDFARMLLQLRDTRRDLQIAYDEISRLRRDTDHLSDSLRYAVQRWQDEKAHRANLEIEARELRDKIETLEVALGKPAPPGETPQDPAKAATGRIPYCRED